MNENIPNEASYATHNGRLKEVIDLDSLITRKYWPFIFIGNSDEDYVLRISEELFDFHKAYLFDKKHVTMFRNFSVKIKQPAAYVLISFPSGKLYIGSSGNARARLATHVQLLREGRHYKRELLTEFNELGDRFIQAVVIYQNSREAALDLEQSLLDRYRNNPLLINCGKNARLPLLGSKLSEERKRNMRRVLNEYWSTPGNREAMGVKKKEFFKIAENRAKVSCGTKNFYKNNPEALKRMAENTKIRFSDPKNRRAHAEKIKGAWAKPELKQKLIEAKSSVSKKLSILGTIYASYNEAGRALNLDPALIRHRVLSNLDVWKDWLLADADGVPILKETLSLDAATILWRKKQREAVASPEVRARMSEIKKRQVMEPSVQRNMRASRTNSKCVSINGVVYHSTEEAARVLGISGATIRNRAESNSDKFKDWYYL